MSSRRSRSAGPSRAAMPPRNMVRHAACGLGHFGSMASTRQPSSRKRRAARSQAALTSGSTARAKPRSPVHATRRPFTPPASDFT